MDEYIRLISCFRRLQ